MGWLLSKDNTFGNLGTFFVTAVQKNLAPLKALTDPMPSFWFHMALRNGAACMSISEGNDAWLWLEMNAIVLPHSAMKLLFKYTLRLWIEAHKLIQFSLFLAFLSSALGSYSGVYATYNNVHMIVA
jgi:hypothetical protein